VFEPSRAKEREFLATWGEYVDNRNKEMHHVLYNSKEIGRKRSLGGPLMERGVPRTTIRNLSLGGKR